MDTITHEHRSWNMARIHSVGTKPEIIVRKVVYALGYRYRLHVKKLPGKPDLVFRNRKKVVFVHGCFWHQHHDPNCRLVRVPKSSLQYWGPKLARNVARDAEHLAGLHALGWSVLIIWECETVDIERLGQKLRAFLA